MGVRDQKMNNKRLFEEINRKIVIFFINNLVIRSKFTTFASE